jgi:iron complex outermembrane receptor protein
VPLYRAKVFAGLELQALSARKSATTSETTPGFLVANFTLFSHELVKGVTVSASSYNLFDHRYSDAIGPDFTQQFIQQDGRTFRVKLTCRF